MDKWDNRNSEGNNQDEMVVCRCEEVTAAEIEAAIAEGYITLDAIKRATRAGMGPCQGRTCSRIIRQLITRTTDRKPSDLLPATSRPPLRPCKLSILANAPSSPDNIHGLKS